MYYNDEDECAFKEINDNPIVLDFTGCKYLGEIHKVLKERFGFPDYYGENWDALWDCLSYYTLEDLRVEIKGLQSLPEEFDEDVQIMLEVFDDVHKETPNITFEILS